MDRPRFDQFQIQHELWRTLAAYYQERLEKLRSQLENPKTAETERAGLIYRIDEIKQLLKIGAQDKPNEAGAGE